MKPLRVAWTRETLDGNALVAWLGHVVAPPSICALDGTLVRAVTATHAVVSWPDEALVLGIEGRGDFTLAWDDATVALDHAEHHELSSTVDGAILVASTTRALPQEPDEVWTLDRRMDWRYRDMQRWALDDFAYATACIERGGRRRWVRDGRAAFVADDVVVFEQTGGTTKEIVGRSAHDGKELWRRAAVDRFVLGGVAMPAWSDDRVFVLDRGARRRAAWAREAEIASFYGISPASPVRVLGFAAVVARARTERPLATPSYLCCVSTRTGDELWRVAIEGDVVSFHAHSRWVAVVSTAGIHAWLPDGTPRMTLPVVHAPDDEWPPSPLRYACIAGGTDDHLLRIDNVPPVLDCIAIDRAESVWEVELPITAVRSSPGMLRTISRASVVLAGDGAFARDGDTIVGLLP